MRCIFKIILLIAISSFKSFSQENDSSEFFFKNDITKVSTLSVHTFGIQFSRIQGHFKMEAPKFKRLSFSLESGNVWSPEVKTYIPKNEAVRAVVKNYNWDQAHTAFDENTIAKDSFSIKNDGVVKGLRANINFMLAKKHEMQIGVRLFMLTKGKLPFTIITSDAFIEGFHEKIIGDTDPFDREVFGFNKASVNYTDRNGNSLNAKSGNFFASGIETSYYYYPESLINKNKSLFFNFGAHLGTNLSASNASLDFGVSMNAIKNFNINDKSNFNIGTSFGILRKSIVNFSSKNLEFGTNNALAYSETALEYSFKSKKGVLHTFGSFFYIQTSLNKKKELEYIIPIRNQNAYNSWGQGVTNLYKNNNYWNFLYSFTKKVTTTFYIQQDFTVSNNPDIQTGIGLSFSLK